MTIHTTRADKESPDELSPVDRFVWLAEGATGRPGRRSGAEVSLLCPAHDDRNPSLSVREADDGRVLAHCYAESSGPPR